MKNKMQYNGYSGEIKYSELDKCYYGVVIDIGDSVSFEGQNFDELQIAFENAIDDYIDMCKRFDENKDFYIIDTVEYSDDCIAEIYKEIAQIKKDIKSGKAKDFDNVDDMFEEIEK